MTLGLRKIILLSLLGGIFLLANVVMIANWLSDKGFSQFAQTIMDNYLTGTAVTIIVALLILLVGPDKSSRGMLGFIKRCPVCEHRLIGGGSYCSECGSKV